MRTYSHAVSNFGEPHGGSSNDTEQIFKFDQDYIFIGNFVRRETMPIVGDFTFIHAKNGQVILGTHADPLRVGDVQGGDGRLVLNFGAGGQNGSQPAMLSMMVRGLTEGSARVVVSGNDNRQVGLIRPFGEAGAPAGSFGSEAAKLWRHEQFFIQNNVLSGANSNSANQLTIFPPPSSIPNTGNFDDFEVRDIYCFFHQNS